MLMWLNVSVATLNAMLYLLVLYRLPRYTHPSLTNMPPYTLAFVAYDHRISPVLACIAYIVPVGCEEPAKSTSLATVTGPATMALLELAVDYTISPLSASITTNPSTIVFIADGLC